MMAYKCLVVDDEPIARRVVKNYLKELPDYQVVEEFGDAHQVLAFLKEHQVDLLFLDIKMPGLSGLEFLKALSHPPKVILVTAYREFALDGFELNVVDYLLKPVSQGRFLQALSRFEERSGSQSHQIEIAEKDHILVKSDRKTFKLPLEKIRFLESQGDYVNFHLEDERISSKMNLGELDKELPAAFIRTHRSFVVNSQYVKAFTAEEVELNEGHIPIGRSYREEALAKLRGD